MKLRLPALTLLIGIAAPSILTAQDLIRAKGHYYFKPSFIYTSYDEVFDMDGERKPTPDATHLRFNVYAEAGLSERWNILLQAPLVVRNEVKASSAPGGFSNDKSNIAGGDIELGVRYGFMRRRNFYAAFTLFQSLGTGKRDDEFSLNTGYADFNTRLQFEVQYKKTDTWLIQLMAGFNNRNKKFGDEAHASALLRLMVVKNLWIDLYGYGIQPMENASEEPRFYLLGLYHNNAGIIYGGSEIRYEKERGTGYFAGVRIPVIGQYHFASPVWQAGISFRFRQKNAEDQN